MDYSDLIGMPFSELHCWDLVREVYRRNGISLQGYSIGVDECKQISLIIAKEIKKVWLRLDAPEDLCVVAMRQNPKYVSHCGVCVGSGMFLQSLSNTGVIITRLNDPIFKNKIEGFYRYVG